MQKYIFHYPFLIIIGLFAFFWVNAHDIGREPEVAGVETQDLLAQESSNPINIGKFDPPESEQVTPTPGGSTKKPTPTSLFPPISVSPIASPTKNPKITSSQKPNDYSSIINAISEQNIREYMTKLTDDNSTPEVDSNQTRWSSYPENATESQYIYDFFNSLGLNPKFQDFNFSAYKENMKTRNVVGRIEGSEFPDEVYLVTSHMDSTALHNSNTNRPAPGADDNGSGTVVVMEVARAIKESGIPLKRSLEFVTFSGEEQGLYGSRHYVANLPSNKKIKGVINLDMVGNSSGAHDCVNFLYKNYNGGDVLSSEIVSVNKQYNIDLDTASRPSSDSRSDHKPFWDKGIPAIFGHECVFSNVYHSVNDTPDKLNYSQISKTAKAVAGALSLLANK